jgi:Protein of unknown function (DUF3990)
VASPTIATAGAIPAWTTINTHLTLYHGCVVRRAASIRGGVQHRRGRPDTDFGRGFYTTTRRHQAEDWAREVYWDLYTAGNPLDPPAVVKFVVPLAELAGLNSLAFVQGDSTCATFWSFIHHCRAGNSHAHPIRIPPEDWYDMVAGPVTSWPPKSGLPLYCHGTYNGLDWEAFDQFSFHADVATDVLNRLDRTNPSEFEILTVIP